MTTLDPAFVYGNYAEAALWTAMGLLALFKRPSPQVVIVGVVLLAFGVSDVVETRTGAWYEPWWLFVWKAVCVLLIAGFGAAAWGQNRAKTEN